MASTDVRRIGNFHTKKLLSQMVLTIDADAKKAVSAAGNYLVAHLPEDCIVQNAYVFTTAVGTGTVDVGSTEGGNDILDDGALITLGKTGTAGAAKHTGTGLPVYVTLSAAVGAATEFHIVIEYLELSVNTGSLTRIK